jgi:hypothetical protein
VLDKAFEYSVPWKADRVNEVLCLRELVHLAADERRIGTEKLRKHFTAIAVHDRSGHGRWLVGAVRVAAANQHAFDNIGPVEQRRRMIAGAFKVPV